MQEGTFHRDLHCLKLLYRVCTAADDRKVTVLIGLDLSAAFNKVGYACCSIAGSLKSA